MFEGFSPETVDFLWGIRMNNNREWFLLHKQEYERTLYRPMKALGQDLFSLFQDRPGTVLKVSRIYKDARMHPATPYKESLWLCIRQDVDWWVLAPCLFFEMRPEGASYGFLLWQPTPAYMERFRQELERRPEEFLSMVQALPVPVSAQCYRRPKQPEDGRLAPYFAWKTNLSAIVEESPGPELFGPELEERVREMFRGLLPLYDYFNRLLS